ncbi:MULTISPECIES: PepSY-associated TM helix domain-containing protein [unclassified Caballeronia]|uniref:PepSY-associated TM helix domain-containing protein n=1 Tax=unclassified Caballeronia TaxID=2646786 RepID=UPI002027D4E1|nr:MULTISPECIES: PepSY-associated TM helix domain-containing protein [unclassified Caballeronia]MDR5773025.1 PepSY-associated TM helix domain-containing protein [Caballeronia sp. LZ002]MDR5803513.1 PepSY-associated TM helix domain-containing protein [Caballeronia sp. LZ001]MDR5848459.1 PepSY-associated TM helix domain-containing protein [Caballeronia sp. LZ003]
MNAPDTLNPQPSATSGASYRPHRLIDDAEQFVRKNRSRRSVFLKWLRKVHGWIGLWGALLGLLFGTTGFLLNHRAPPLRISTGEPQVSQMQMPLPAEGFKSPRDMGTWLKKELKIDGQLGRTRREPAHPVGWGDKSTMQPEQWSVALATPGGNVQAEYWVGNNFVSVKRTENTFLAMMTNLHKGVGLSVGWVLLIDTFAGSIILLSLTGVLLWTELNKRRTAGVVIVTVSLIAAIVCGLM